MKKTILITSLVLLVVGVFPTVNIAADSESTVYEIEGVLGVTPVLENTCVAAYIPMGQQKAISGIRWYNGDPEVVFPGILVTEGGPGRPAQLDVAVLVAQSVQGTCVGWNEVKFSEPVACGSDGLYVLFQLPVGSEFSHTGSGGGSGFGFTKIEGGYPCWLSIDGAEWVNMNPEYGMALQPVLVDADTRMMRAISSEGTGAAGATETYQTSFGMKGPNPCNPKAEFRFTLAATGPVCIDLYDLKGRVIKNLLSETYSRGEHGVIWNGDDNAGRKVASGIYLALFRAGGFVQSQRVALVK